MIVLATVLDFSISKGEKMYHPELPNYTPPLHFAMAGGERTGEFMYPRNTATAWEVIIAFGCFKARLLLQ